MESCDTCPGGEACHGHNLRPVLRRVFALHSAGVTNKFELLDRLSEEDEALLEEHARGLTAVCWSKAALLATTDLLAELPTGGDPPVVVEDRLRAVVAAFERFPWRIGDLVTVAPELHQLVEEQAGDDAPVGALGRRAFVNLCKRVVWDR